MTIADVAAHRLHNEHLLEDLKDPIDVVRSLGAVQAQDFVGAKWALGMRCHTTDQAVTELFNEGKILRAHALRPTWHFVAAEDIRWIQELTGPRVHAFNKYYYKKMGVVEPTTKKVVKVLKSALAGGNYLTRTELSKLFESSGIPEASGLRCGYFLIYAELEAIICSGPMKGKQHTYALLEERAPQAKSMPRDQALKELTRRYFTSHGPAQIADFAWWSSLTTADIKKGIELAKLKSVSVEGKVHYYANESSTTVPSPIIHLLPNYDEYYIGYKDRSAFSMRYVYKVMRKPGYEDLFYHMMALNGQLIGGWRRDIKGKVFNVKLNPFIELSPQHKKALDKAVKRLSDFSGLPVALN